jgi:predicted P-loop ATPase/GTPase
MSERIFKFGFVTDEKNLRLEETFKDGVRLKEMHIELYPNNPMESHNPFKLFIRAIEKNVVVSNDGNRLMLKKSDRFETHITNILLSDITECLVKTDNEHYSTFVVKVQDIWYKIEILY